MSEYIVELNNNAVSGGKFLLGAVYLDAQEIVRCRDCERVTIDQGDHDYREPLWCGLFHTDVSLDGFCAWGREKRSE